MGGGACVIIIEGESALAAIEIYDASKTIHPKAETAYLRGQIEASCELAPYLSIYSAIEDEEIPDENYNAIILFHQGIAANIMHMTATEIENAAITLRKLNENLAASIN